MNLPVEGTCVMTKNDEEAAKVERFLKIAAGYCSTTEYGSFFDEEDNESYPQELLFKITQVNPNRSNGYFNIDIKPGDVLTGYLEDVNQNGQGVYRVDELEDYGPIYVDLEEINSGEECHMHESFAYKIIHKDRLRKRNSDLENKLYQSFDEIERLEKQLRRTTDRFKRRELERELKSEKETYNRLLKQMNMEF